MQMFIPSVLSALKALLKGPTWLWRIISIFFGRRKFPPPPSIPSSALHSPSDPSYESAHSQHQRSYERTYSRRQRLTQAYHPYPPARPVAEYSRSSSPHRSPSQYTTYQSDPQPSVRFPARPAPRVSPDVALVTEPVQSYIPQSPSARQLLSQHTPHQSNRQPSVRFPAEPTPPVSPDVAPVTKPVREHIPRRSRRSSGPELATRALEVAVTPIVIDLHEDPASLRLEAKREESRMAECFKQSYEAFDRGDRELAEKLSLRGKTHKVNKERLNMAASTKIFQEYNKGLIGSDTIDLHRLFVSEAKMYFYDAVQEVRDRGELLLHVIVGKGNRSKNKVARIKPAIQEYGRSLGLGVEVDPDNDGRLDVLIPAIMDGNFS